MVGHSTSGIMAFEVAARYPELSSVIVILDAAMVLPSAAHAAIPEFLERLRGSDYRAALRDFAASSLIVPTDDQERETCTLMRASALRQPRSARL
jgi:pimeloyl-ACP methyl ester carboxylesterase